MWNIWNRMLSVRDVQWLSHIFLKVGHGFNIDNSVIVGTDLNSSINGPAVIDFIFSCDQAALWMVFSVRLSVRLSVCPSVTPFWLCSHHRIIMQFLGVITMDQGKVHAKGQGQRSKVKVTEVTTQLDRFQFEFTYDDEILYIAWCCWGEVPYCFSRSSVKFQGHTALKIAEFDRD